MNSPASPEVLVIGSVTVVRPGPDLSNLYESQLDHLNVATELASTLAVPKLVIDMQHVRFIGSAFLGRMISLHRTTTARDGGRFALCGPSTFCRAAIGVAKLDTVLEIFDSVEQADAAWAQA
jgi:anti-anti-sigma factor